MSHPIKKKKKRKKEEIKNQGFPDGITIRIGSEEESNQYQKINGSEIRKKQPGPHD